MHRTPFRRESMLLDFRRGLDAFVATAIGTMAGLLADSGFGVRMWLVNAVYRVLGPLFDIFSAFPNGQLVLAGFVYRIPVVLLVGLVVGLFLRHIKYPRLLLCSVLAWPVYLAGRKLAIGLPLLVDGAAGGAGPTFLQINFIADLALYSMQYGLLVLVIRATDTVLARSARRKGVSRGMRAI
jgi:hypothetical protein